MCDSICHLCIFDGDEQMLMENVEHEIENLFFYSPYLFK